MYCSVLAGGDEWGHQGVAFSPNESLSAPVEVPLTALVPWKK